MSTEHDNPLRSRVNFVGVDEAVVETVRETSHRRLEISTMDNVEQLLTASGLGTLDCEVVILGAGVAEPVRLAQRIHTLDRNIQIIILAEDVLAGEYERAIDYTPFLGDAVNLLAHSESGHLAESIRRAVKRAHRRCSYRQRGSSTRNGNGDGAPQGAELATYLGNVLEHAPIGMLTLDNDGRIQTLNRRGRDILDVTEKDVLDTPFLSFFMPVDQIRLNRILQGDESFAGHFTVGFDSNDRRYVEVTASDFLSRSGQPGRMVILHDVTGRVKAENARRRAAAALQSSEDRFMELAEVLRLIPWEADARTRKITFVGEQAEDILGFPRSQWYEENFWEQAVHEDDRDAAIKERWDNSRRLQNFDHQYRMVTADGRTVWIHDIVNVVRDELTQPAKLRGFMVDVSEGQQLAFLQQNRAG